MKTPDIISEHYKHIEGSFSGYDKTERYWQAWLSEPASSHSLIIHHGLGEHCGRYQNIVSAFAGKKVNIFTYDVASHGRSKGKRGRVKSIGELSLDLAAFLLMLKEKFQVQKPILYGHSMGSLVVSHFAISHKEEPLRALVLSAVPVEPILSFSQRVKLLIAHCLRPFFPRLVLPSGLPPEALSSDPDFLEPHLQDPLVDARIGLSLGMSILEEGKGLLQKAKGISLPALLIHGEEDAIAGSSGSQRLFAALSSENKKLMICPGLYHEVHNESPAKRERPIAELRAWVLRHFS